MRVYSACEGCKTRMKTNRLPGHVKSGQCERMQRAPEVWTRKQATCALEGCEETFTQQHEAHESCCREHAEALREQRGQMPRRMDTNPGERLSCDEQMARVRHAEECLRREVEAAGARILTPEASYALWLRVLEVAA